MNSSKNYRKCNKFVVTVFYKRTFANLVVPYYKKRKNDFYRLNEKCEYVHCQFLFELHYNAAIIKTNCESNPSRDPSKHPCKMPSKSVQPFRRSPVIYTHGQKMYKRTFIKTVNKPNEYFRNYLIIDYWRLEKKFDRVHPLA